MSPRLTIRNPLVALAALLVVGVVVTLSGIYRPFGGDADDRPAAARPAAGARAGEAPTPPAAPEQPGTATAEGGADGQPLSKEQKRLADEQARIERNKAAQNKPILSSRAEQPAGSPESGATPPAGDARPGAPRTAAPAGVLEAMLNLILLTVVMVAVLFFVVWAFRKLFPSTRKFFASPLVVVLGRNYISSRQSILLLRVGGKVLVVGVTGDRMTTLTEITDPDTVARFTAEEASRREGSLQQTFAGVIREAQTRFLKRKGADSADLERVLEDEAEAPTPASAGADAGDPVGAGAAPGREREGRR
ncbi:MAG: flagellar biosynthetic protein FliO [Planctomycetes bacterium]|nr:flagellar biosynthetic protein FliO [Planctomycetota bacterium]